MAGSTFEALVTAVDVEAETVRSYELAATGANSLPAFSAGSHIDLHLPNGMVRSYSLVNHQAESHRYLIGIHRDHAGRGGSQYVHDNVRVGDTVVLSEPRNNFPLREDAPYSVLIGGGIGITPLLSMMRRLSELGRPYEAHYVARTRAYAPFMRLIDDLRRSAEADIRVYFDQETPGSRLDIASVVGAAAHDAHLYCCGPGPMLEAFHQATAQRGGEFVHIERFGSAEKVKRDSSFQIELARSGLTLDVDQGQSILDVLLKAGIDVAFSCEEGVCGTCEVAVLAGLPDHRDQYLTGPEREQNKTMMICCSRSLSAKLVLDL